MAKSGPKTTIPSNLIAVELHQRLIHLCHRVGGHIVIGAGHLKQIPDMATMLGKKIFVFCKEKSGVVRGYVGHLVTFVTGKNTKHVFIIEGTEILAW